MVARNYEFSAEIGQIFGGYKIVKFIGVGWFNSGARYETWLVECVRCGKEFERVSGSVKKNSHGCNNCSKRIASGRDSVHWRGGKYVPGFFITKTRASCDRGRKILFDVSIDYLDGLWEKQEGRCYYSGEEICFGNNYTQQTASLDRVDSSKDYIEGNVVFVYKDDNLMKWQLSEERFLQLCGQITENSEVMINAIH